MIGCGMYNVGSLGVCIASPSSYYSCVSHSGWARPSAPQQKKIERPPRWECKGCGINLEGEYRELFPDGLCKKCGKPMSFQNEVREAKAETKAETKKESDDDVMEWINLISYMES